MAFRPSIVPLAAPALLLLTLTAPIRADLPPPVMNFLNQHCFECHDEDVQKGGLDLTATTFDLSQPSEFSLWERILHRVDTGEMPPEKKPRPVKDELDAFVATLHQPLLDVDQTDIRTHGRVRLRRLTRVEYEHTLHDLLGVDVPLVELLPDDPSAHGFQTVANAQQLSHFQLARYLDVADLALDEAFTRALKGDSEWKKFITPKDTLINRGGNYRGPELRNGESLSWPMGLQFFGRMSATTVPEDGWYRVTVKAVRAINPDKDGVVWGTVRSGICESNAPLLFPVGLIEATSEPRDMVYEAWISKGHRLELKPHHGAYRRPPNGAMGGNVSFKGRDLAKEGYQGLAHKGILMERIYPIADRERLRRLLFPAITAAEVKAQPRPSLQRAVAAFAEKAFRRPVTPEQLAPYLQIGETSLENGDSFPDALRASYRAILCSPRFLTFVESPGKLDSHAVASRLSYALWVSMPDPELLSLAKKDQLTDPSVLRAQVDRMLQDPKALRFVNSFTDQWLKLKEIDFTTPDPRQFKEFDTVLQQSMILETRRYFEELVREDLSVSCLVDSNFTFLTSRLAQHYGLADRLKPGAGLQKVSLRPDEPRGGLVTQGAVLKVTADGTHTSPVVRGVFINERILGVHIPPPPPGVPAIEPDIRGATSIRDQLEKHRNNESCASCHLTIDPPGFALEVFDPVGQLRHRYGTGGKGVPVDPSGATPDGATFAGLREWQTLYSQRADQLARGFTEQFLTYATGATIRFSDESAVEKIVQSSKKSGFGLRSLITGSLLSPVFLQK